MSFPPPQQSAQGQGPGAPAHSTADERTWGMLCHLGIILFGFIPPLIVYLVKKDESPFLRAQGAAGLNFSITAVIAYVALGIFSSILAITGLGVFAGLLWLVVWIVVVIFAIQAGMAANRGEQYKYPIALPLIK